MTAQVTEEVVPAFFIRFGAHRDAATGLLMRGGSRFFFGFGAHRDAATGLFMRGGSRLLMRGVVGACL
jgi:hypothetical protein